jgi:hypothetical protein
VGADTNFHVFFTAVETAVSRVTVSLRTGWKINLEVTMNLHDCRGLAVSTHNAASLTATRGPRADASYFVDPLATINEALADDPSFASTACAQRWP